MANQSPQKRLPGPDDGRCLVPGCDDPHHARGFCGRHFMQWRRSPDGDPPLPSVKEARRRERLIRDELSLGCLGEAQGIDPGNTMFASEDERREAWEKYGDELTAEAEARRIGSRPHAWWIYVAGRPQYLGRCPSMHDADLAERTRWRHHAEVEKWSWLAANGHLTADERAWVATRGREARKRIGTPGEHKAALSPDFGGDKEDAAIAEAVEAQS